MVPLHAWLLKAALAVCVCAYVQCTDPSVYGRLQTIVDKDSQPLPTPPHPSPPKKKHITFSRLGHKFLIKIQSSVGLHESADAPGA